MTSIELEGGGERGRAGRSAGDGSPAFGCGASSLDACMAALPKSLRRDVMIDHDRAVELLSRRAELSVREKQELGQHLSTCAECQRTEEAFAAQDELLRPLAQSRPPSGI